MSVKVATETKFMEHFSVGTGVTPGAGVWSATNRDGDVEVFTIGRDGLVQNYFPDPTSNTGYSTTSLGSAQAIGVVTNSDGNITVFLSFNLELHMVVQQPGEVQRWSTPQPLNYPRPTDGGSISEIYPTLVESAIYVALRIPMDGGVSGLVIGCLDGNAEPTFNLSPNKYPVSNYVWLGTTRKALRLALIYTSITTLTPDTLTQVQLPFNSSFTAWSVTVVADDLYAVLDDGNVYHLDLTNGVYSWTALTESQSFNLIYGVVTNTSTTHLLLISADADLWHMAKDPSLQPEFSSPLPIGANAFMLSVVLNGDGQIDMFAPMPASVTHIFFQQESGDWQIAPLNVPLASGVETYSCYGSDISFHDDLGTPLPLTGVTVWTSEPAVLQIEGAVYAVGPDRKARVTTNIFGVLNVQQPTTGLSVPPLLLNVPDLMAPNDVVTNAQDAVVQQSLASLTGPELLNATTADDTKVLPSQYRTEQSADAIANAVTVSMQLASHVQACAPAATATILRPRPGLGTALSADLPALRKLTGTSTEVIPSWQLYVGDDGQASFEVLTAEQAAAKLATLRRTTHSDDGFWDFFSDLGDLIEGAAQGLLDIVHTVVNTVSDGVHVAINFVVDGVQHLFETVVKTVEQAFDLVAAVFAQVKVFFKTLFAWLGFILDRGDIARTTRALAYMAIQFLDFVDGASTKIQSQCDSLFQSLAGQMDSMLDAAIQALGPDSTVGGYAGSKQPDDPKLSLAVSNNVLLNHYINNAGSFQANNLVLPAVQANLLGWDDIVTKLTQIADKIMQDPGFTAVDQFFSTMGESIDNLFHSLLATLLKAVKVISAAILSGIQSAIDMVFDEVRALIAGAKGLITTPWNIPVLSAIFSNLVPGVPLTLLNLVAAIVALPVTAIYKISMNSSPFADDDAVSEFEQSVSASNMLALGPFNMDAKSFTPGAITISHSTETLLGVLGGAMMMFTGQVNAVIDAAPKLYLTELAMTQNTILAGVADLLALTALYPWFYDHPVVGMPAHWDNALWVLWLEGNFITWFFLYIEFYAKVTLPENTETIVWVAFGAAYIAVTSLGTKKAEEYLSAVQPFFQFLGIPRIAKATRYVSVVALSVGGLICTNVAGGLVIHESAKP